MARYRKRRNPLPNLRTKKEDALKLVEIISKNAGVAEDESVLGPEADPENIFTPINLVAHSVKPKVRREMLKILIGNDEPFYRGVIEEIEEQGLPPYQDGNIPNEWLKERVRRGKTSNLLRDKYNLWSLDYEGAHPSYDSFRNKLSYGSLRKRNY